MNVLECKNLIKDLIISNNITSEIGLLDACKLNREQIEIVVDWLIEDGFIELGKPNVVGRTFTISKD